MGGFPARIGVLVAALASVAGLAEGLLRAAGYVPIYAIYSRPELFWRHDERLGWSLEPGARGRYVGPRPYPVEFDTAIEINSLGLRGPEIAAREAGEVRILFLGDSAVAGFEVEQHETFSALLEANLERQLGIPIRVINAGIRGYGTDQSYLWFRERGRDLAPDLVAAVFSANDFEDNMLLHRPRRPFGKPAFALRAHGGLELLGTPVPQFEFCSTWELDNAYRPTRVDGWLARNTCRLQTWLTDRSALLTLVATSLARVPGAVQVLRNWLQPGSAAGSGGGRASFAAAGISLAGPRGESRSRAQGELATALLRALAREVRASGARFLLLMLPGDSSRVDVPTLRAAGIKPRFVDSQPGMGAIRFHNDPHMNAAGHRFYADGLMPIVAEQVQAILRERERLAVVER